MFNKIYLEVLKLSQEINVLSARISEIYYMQRYITDNFDYIVNMDPNRTDQLERIVKRYKALVEKEKNE